MNRSSARRLAVPESRRAAHTRRLIVTGLVVADKSPSYAIVPLLICASLLMTFLFLEIGFRLYYALVSPQDDPRRQLERADQSTPPPAAADCRAPGAALASLGNMIRISEFSDIVYEFKPGITVCAFAGNRVTINRAGFRAPRDYSLEKPPGTFRVIGL